MAVSAKGLCLRASFLGMGCAAPRPPSALPLPAPPVRVTDASGYRGTQGLGAAFGALKWGMTLAEAYVLLGDAAYEGDTSLVREELVAQRPATVHYLFRDGQLARVLVVYSAEAAGAAEDVQADLRSAFGNPLAFRRGANAPAGMGTRASNAQRDLEVSAALFSIVAAVAGTAASRYGGGSWSWDTHANAPPSRSSDSCSRPSAPPSLAAGAPTGGGVDAFTRPVREHLRAPLEELAYARWESRETVVEWAAHEWTPELLLTSFESRVLLGAAR
jgi:hypothetical protein